MTRITLNPDLGEAAAAFGFIGFPWDMGASLGRPGARYAPEAIRRALGWHFDRIRADRVWDVEGEQVVDLAKARIVDRGDVALAYHDRSASFARATSMVGEALAAGEVPLVLGGDHSISFPPIRALSEVTEGPVGIIQVDAHLDLVDSSEVQGRYSQSSQIRRALELPNVTPRRLVQIGLRGLNYPEYKEYCEEQGILQITAPKVASLGAAAVAERALARAGQGGAAVYMTLDIDAVTPMAAPGAGHLEFAGLSPAVVSRLVKTLAPSVNAFDIAEVNPTYDFKDMTANLAAKLLFDFILGSLVGDSAQGSG